MQRIVRARRVFVGQVLEVVWQYECRDPALAARNADRSIDEVANLRRHHRRLYEGAGDVLEHGRDVNFLLIMPADRRPSRLSDDRQHRHMVEPSVVKSGDQMCRARTGGGNADTQLVGKLRVGRGHERGHLLMPHLDEFDLALGPLQRAKHAVDAVARIAVDPPHAPLVKALDKEIADGLGHGISVLAM